MQRETEESEGYTEGDKKNIRSPASEPLGRETGTSGSTHTQRTLCVCLCQEESVLVSKHRGKHVRFGVVELGQLLLLEPQLVQLSAEKGTEGLRRKGKKEESGTFRGINEEIPVPTEKL